MDAREFFAVIASRRILVLSVILVGVIAGFVAWKLSGPSFHATASVLISPESDPGRESAASPADMPSLLLSDTVLERFRARMNSDDSLKDLRRRIDAQIDLNSSLMPIGFTAPTKREAIAGANALAEELHRFYQEISSSRYDDLSRYLSGALDSERNRIATIDAQVQTLVANDPYIAERDAGTQIAAQVLALQTQRSAIAASLQSHALIANLAHQRIDTIQPLVKQELLSNDPYYKALADEVSKDRTQQDIVRAQFTDKFAGAAGLTDQIERTQSVMQAEAERATSQSPGGSPSYSDGLKDEQTADGAVATDRNMLASIDQQLSENEAHLADLPTIGVKVATLRRERDADENAYEILSEQRTITLATQAQAAALGTVTIAGRAEDAEPAIGRGSFLLPIAATLGFVFLAFALPFGLEIVDPRLRGSKNIGAVYGAPVIASL
jgi:uncharacterized protein involved in exopolysaccharide biosynthesis